MSDEYYGATAEAQARINLLLRLPATGREQDWEFEFSDASRIQEMVNLFKSKDLDIDSQCALALLIVASVDGVELVGDLGANTMIEVANIFKANETVRKRMMFYWVDLGRASRLNLVQNLVGFEHPLSGD